MRWAVNLWLVMAVVGCGPAGAEGGADGGDAPVDALLYISWERTWGPCGPQMEPCSGGLRVGSAGDALATLGADETRTTLTTADLDRMREVAASGTGWEALAGADCEPTVTDTWDHLEVSLEAETRRRQVLGCIDAPGIAEVVAAVNRVLDAYFAGLRLRPGVP